MKKLSAKSLIAMGLAALTAAGAVLMPGCKREKTEEPEPMGVRENVGPFGDMELIRKTKAENKGYASQFVWYDTEAEAKAGGVPDGFSGSVASVTGKANGAFTVNLGDVSISPYAVESMTFRFFAPSEVRRITLIPDGGDVGEDEIFTKVLLQENRGKWVEVTIAASDEGFTSSKTFGKLADDKGLLSKFTVNFGFVAKEPVTAYIDEFSYKLKADKDITAPVLTYKGPLEFDLTAEKPFHPEKDASAEDSFERRNVPPTLVWEGTPGTDEKGNMIEGGPYVGYITAEDTEGNRSQVKITLNVRPKDTEPPVIRFFASELYAEEGTFLDRSFYATDNEDEVKVKVITEKGTLDAAGRLLPGDHVMTLKAEDLTGNKTEEKIVIHVSAKTE